MNKKGFTLIEMLTVITLIGIILVIAIPNVRKLTYNNNQKKYAIHEKIVKEATKLYVKKNKAYLEDTDKDCFNVNYSELVNKGLLEEEDITCSGNIYITKKSSGKGYSYEYGLTCKDKKATVVHQNNVTGKLSCMGLNGDFGVSYKLYNDLAYTTPYETNTWEKYVYAEYSNTNSYNVDLDHYEYTEDLLNWKKITDSKKDYTNFNGNIYVRAVDKAGNISSAVGHHVKVDSVGPEYAVQSDENSITSNNTIKVTLANVKDKGVGVDTTNTIYSFDGGSSWVSSNSREYALTETGTVTVKDKLGNLTANDIQVVKACSGGDATATAANILSGKTAWIGGSKITGTMTNQGSKTASLNAGGTYTIPAGYHDGTGKVTANSLSSQTTATATAEDILSGKTAWVNGTQVTGTNKGEAAGYEKCANSLFSGNTYTLTSSFGGQTSISHYVPDSSRNTSASSNGTGTSAEFYVSKDLNNNSGILLKISIPYNIVCNYGTSCNATAVFDLYNSGGKVDSKTQSVSSSSRSDTLIFTTFDYKTTGYFKVIVTMSTSGRNADTGTPGISSGSVTLGTITLTYAKV